MGPRSRVRSSCLVVSEGRETGVSRQLVAMNPVFGFDGVVGVAAILQEVGHGPPYDSGAGAQAHSASALSRRDSPSWPMYPDAEVAVSIYAEVAPADA